MEMVSLTIHFKPVLWALYGMYVSKVAAGFLVDVRKERPKIWIDPSVQRLGHPFGLIGWLESF